MEKNVTIFLFLKNTWLINGSPKQVMLNWHVSFIRLHFFAKLCETLREIFDYQFLAEFRKVSQRKKCKLLLSGY